MQCVGVNKLKPSDLPQKDINAAKKSIANVGGFAQ